MEMTVSYSNENNIKKYLSDVKTKMFEVLWCHYSLLNVYIA